MKQSAILSAVGSAILASAHGIVSDLNIGGTVFAGSNPYQDKYMNPVPQRIVWAFPDAGNGPVEDVSTADITCNKGATPAALSAPVAAGAKVTFTWTTWPESHRGPAMTYMADCGGPCAAADPTKLSFFKIDHAGLHADGSWASDDVIKANGAYTVTIPADIRPGNYMLRHELLALHSAGNVNGAQFYPMCANLVVSGTGSATPAGVRFPGAYSATDPGILVSIYNNPKSYTIPGPAVYVAGGAPAPAPVVPSPAPVVPSPAPVVPSPAPVVPTTTAAVAVPTTLATLTRSSSAAAVVPTTTAQAPATTGKTSVDINACLDEVNRCIGRMQTASGGPVDFSSCEAQRAACY